jgi:hypothetical protein
MLGPTAEFGQKRKNGLECLLKMKLSQHERQALIGPAVVGIVVGILFAVCTVAFNSDYKPAAHSGWLATSDVMLSFAGGFLLAFLPFGLAPVLVGRIRTDKGSKRR